jgi:hypothetical protein
MIRDLLGYQFSTDYAALFELAKKQSVVCEVEYLKNWGDICATRYDPIGDITEVSARGISYIWANDIETFRAQCEHVNLRWIPPAQLIPVSERLPEPFELDAEGRCWWFAPGGGEFVPSYRLCENPQQPRFTHWRPHWAISLPQSDRGETEIEIQAIRRHLGIDRYDQTTDEPHLAEPQPAAGSLVDRLRRAMDLIPERDKASAEEEIRECLYAAGWGDAAAVLFTEEDR